ncbi:MAG: GGDEF domain-containing protein [Clostridiales bacterium]|jgi:diguanylate cyclase (GGDEF)-like protein|nr:GGDEF domain-containing protein [Clostridiales bacterium]
MIDNENALGVFNVYLDSLKNVLNILEVMIMATVPETGEILFISERTKEFFGVKVDGVGQICHKYLLGKDMRCEWCPYEKIVNCPGKVLHWEKYSPTSQKTYRLTGAIVELPVIGRVHLEVGLEVTDTMRQRKALESVLNGIDALITVADPYTNEILFLNDAIRENFGIEGDGVGQICHKLLQGLDEPCESCPYLRLQEEPDKTFKWEHKESIKGDVLQKTAKLIDWLDGKKAHLEYAIDVTDKRNLENNIIYLESEIEKVYYDTLTGVYSRRFFEENIDKLIASLSRSNSSLSIMMIDIDFFKNYNDAYGHIKGDECLKSVAEALQNCTMRKEDFVARYGGEEFVVVLPNTDETGAAKIAEKMLQTVRNLNIPHKNSAAAQCVTISIGAVTGLVKHTHNREDYLNRADEMCYRSKQDGRDRCNLSTL